MAAAFGLRSGVGLSGGLGGSLVAGAQRFRSSVEASTKRVSWFATVDTARHEAFVFATVSTAQEPPNMK